MILLRHRDTYIPTFKHNSSLHDTYKNLRLHFFVYRQIKYSHKIAQLNIY